MSTLIHIGAAILMLFLVIVTFGAGAANTYDDDEAGLLLVGMVAAVISHTIAFWLGATS